MFAVFLAVVMAVVTAVTGLVGGLGGGLSLGPGWQSPQVSAWATTVLAQGLSVRAIRTAHRTARRVPNFMVISPRCGDGFSRSVGIYTREIFGGGI